MEDGRFCAVSVTSSEPVHITSSTRRGTSRQPPPVAARCAASTSPTTCWTHRPPATTTTGDVDQPPADGQCRGGGAVECMTASLSTRRTCPVCDAMSTSARAALRPHSTMPGPTTDELLRCTDHRQTRPAHPPPSDFIIRVQRHSSNCWLVAWSSGRALVFGRCAFTVLRSACS